MLPDNPPLDHLYIDTFYPVFNIHRYFIKIYSMSPIYHVFTGIVEIYCTCSQQDGDSFVIKGDNIKSCRYQFLIYQAQIQLQLKHSRFSILLPPTHLINQKSSDSSRSSCIFL